LFAYQQRSGASVSPVSGPAELPPPPSTPEGDAAAALEDYSRAAQRLIGQGRPREKLREVEKLALELALALGAVFLKAPEDAFAAKLRRALTELKTETLAERRAWAVRAILQWAPAWQKADDRNRPWVIRQLMQALVVSDAAFEDVNTESLGEKLANYQAAGASGEGVQSAEAILASIVAEDCDALGLTSDPNEPEQAELERIRKALTPDVETDDDVEAPTYWRDPSASTRF